MARIENIALCAILIIVNYQFSIVHWSEARAARGALGVRTAICDDRLGERHGKADRRG